MPLDMPPRLAHKPPAKVKYAKFPCAPPYVPRSGCGINQVEKRFNEITYKDFSSQPIEYMRLPAPGWWTRVPAWSHYPGSYDYEFMPRKCSSYYSLDDRDRPKFSIYSIGKRYITEAPVPPLLKLPPHTLSRQERKAFEMPEDGEAYTGYLQGKMALFREFELNGKRHYSIEVNHNAIDSVPFVSVSISFAANPADYKRYIKQIKECLKTIKWTDKNTITVDF